MTEQHVQSIFGLPIRESAAFPHQFQCSKCCGTGEGDTSTYCTGCNGAGEVRVEGAITNGHQTTLLISPLPKLFAPYFPGGIVPAPQLSQGLT